MVQLKGNLTCKQIAYFSLLHMPVCVCAGCQRIIVTGNDSGSFAPTLLSSSCSYTCLRMYLNSFIPIIGAHQLYCHGLLADQNSVGVSPCLALSYIGNV